MYRKLALTAVLAVALAVTGYAQKKDFSGTWTLDQAATDAAATTTTTTGGGGAGPLTIKQTADSLSIERQGRGGTPTTTTYKLDGSEQEITMGQATVKAKAKWDGDKIAVETVRAGQDGTPVTSWTIYALDDKGVLWVETKSAQGSVKRAYKKTT
jgi:pectate lyase